MSKFTLKCDNQGVINTLEFEEEYLPMVLENIEVFLMGCGYVIDNGALNYLDVDVDVSMTKTPYDMTGIGDTVCK